MFQVLVEELYAKGKKYTKGTKLSQDSFAHGYVTDLINAGFIKEVPDEDTKENAEADKDAKALDDAKAELDDLSAKLAKALEADKDAKKKETKDLQAQVKEAQAKVDSLSA